VYALARGNRAEEDQVAKDSKSSHAVQHSNMYA